MCISKVPLVLIGIWLMLCSHCITVYEQDIYLCRLPKIGNVILSDVRQPYHLVGDCVHVAN